MGVSVTTVERWVDDGTLPAAKTVGGHRKILLRKVLRLIQQEDHPHADLSDLAGGLPRTTAQADAGAACRRLTELLQTNDQAAVTHLLAAAYRAGLAVDVLADQVIAAAMQRVGDDWAAGRIDVYHEHLATQLCATALLDLNERLAVPPLAKRPLALGCCLEGDFYHLATLLIQMALRDNGWNTLNLGPNTPLAALRAALKKYRPKLLWISFSYLRDGDRFLDEYLELYAEAERLGVLVAVGGRALGENLRTRMPYTFHGDGIAHLTAFARTLHPPTRRPRRGRPQGGGKGDG